MALIVGNAEFSNESLNFVSGLSVLLCKNVILFHIGLVECFKTQEKQKQKQ